MLAWNGVDICQEKIPQINNDKILLRFYCETINVNKV
jgi:hypothetical protein